MVILPGKVIAVDFDGTIVTDKFPEIGEPNLELIEWLKKYREYGGKLILWTCRNDQEVREAEPYALTKALNFCQSLGLQFDSINKNLPEVIEKYSGDTRKVMADYYLDDKNVGVLDWKIMN